MEAIFSGSNVNVLLVIIALVAVMFAVTVVMIPYLKKKGINISGILTAAETGLDTADLAVDGLKGFLPSSPTVLIVDKVIDWAKKGVEAAEQLYHINGITGDQRKAEATKFVYDALGVAKISITPEIEKIIDACIEAAVFVMGHAPKEDDGSEGYGATAL